MVIDLEVITTSSKKGRNSIRHQPKWAIYGAAGVGVLFSVGLIKAFLPLIG